LRAQAPSGSTKPDAPNAPQASAKVPTKETQKPAEKAPETQPGTLRLENPPEAPTTPAEQKPPTPSQQPSAAPPRATKQGGTQKLQLETPPAAPTGPEAKPAGPKPAQPEGPKQAVIEDIICRGNRRIPANTLRARIFSHKGDIYDENSLERDFMALWNTGFLDDIRLEVSDGEKGKILTFFVREKKLIRSIDYKGLSTVQQSDVLDEFKKRKVGLSIQSQYDPVVIKRAEVVLQDMLSAHGKMFATVRARTRNIPPNSVALTFIVVEGPKVKMGKVSFTGNTVFSGHRLERAMKYSRPSGAPPWFYWFHKTYDKERIQADLENIRELYRENGYFFALAKEPATKMVDTKRRWPFFFWSWGHGKRVDMNIPVEEGDQYRLGKFTIRGNKLFKQEQLAPILQLKTGDVFNLSKVRKSIENYTKLYGGFGYINFTAEPDIEPDRKRKIINLALDFVEDKQFFVHRIEFSGNTKTRDKVIRRELMIDEGNVFSSTLWDYSVLKMNQLGFFDQIKKEDYEIKQNAKDSTIDILVKVKEKGRNSIGFSGGVSGLAGNFVGVNYATNNFLGLGETLSLQFQWGTFEKLYSFGFTEPYIFDRPITTGFTIFKSDYKYDQARFAAYYSGLNPNAFSQSPYAQALFQNFEQNSSGFTVFASYPLRRSFARVGLTYSYTKSSMQAFSLASQAYFEAINFRGLVGPNALSGITQSQVMPTYLYNTVDNDWTPHRGKYIYAGLGFSGSILGGNVNTIRPVFEFKYYHPVNHQRNVLAFHFVGSVVSGFGGLVAPPFSRFYIGGETDLRGFYIRSISPIAFFPTIGSVCNRDANGNKIWATDSHGTPQVGTCGSSTQFPYNTPIYPGGDSDFVTNAEYRIPIAGPVTLAYFVDLGMNPVLFPGQLQIDPSSLSSLHSAYPYFPLPKRLSIISATNFRPHGSTGLELQVILPIVNAPVRVFYGYNFLRLNENVPSPQGAALPPRSMFPNDATYIDALQFFQPFRLQDKKGMVGFTVARTF
jgi:outer membrane protein insertion porin family